MKYNVYLLQYNNYYNRQVKKLETLQEYINGGYVINTLENCNFEFADGIASKLIINYSYVTDEPDYIIVEDRTTNKISRWFIIDSNLNRGGQYEFTVKRDICVDYYNILLDSTYFIERGYVRSNNKLIFNDEGQKYSQIKKSQTPIYDRTKVPWIIGYIPRKSGEGTDGKLYDNKTITTNVYTGDEADYYVNGIANWQYNQYVGSSNKISSEDTEMPYQVIYRFPVQNNVNGNTMKYQYLGISLDYCNHRLDDRIFLEAGATQYQTGVYAIDKTSSQYNNLKDQFHYWYSATPRTNSAIQLLDCQIADNVVSNSYSNYSATLTKWRNSVGRWHTVNNSVYNQLQGLAGQTIKDTSDGKLYKISVVTDTEDMNEYVLTLSDTDDLALYNALDSLLPASVSGTYGSSIAYGYAPSVAERIRTFYWYKTCYITLTETADVTTIVPKDDINNTIYRTHLVDAPYDMFAIPYGPLSVRTGTSTYVTTKKDAGLAIAQAFVTELGTDLVYDLQLLPYCPVSQYIQNDGTFDIRGATDTQVREVTSAGATVNFVFYCNKSQFELSQLRNENDNVISLAVTNVKKQYNTEMYRLCSPNFASTFEFSPAMNGGVQYFEASCTYKPFTPYIRVHPKFSNMYGINEKDGRGLILQGDFSLPRVSDQWTDYELRNKNYLNIFNREIQSLELQDQIGQQTDWFKGISGVITGTIGGIVGGSYLGGGAGAIAGGAAGSILSGVGGALDIVNNQSLRNDAITKAKDNFNWNMQNIKALPYSLANVSALTYDNALVPVLEFYQASDEEIAAFEKKMQYYGMSVMTVANTLTDYLNPSAETFIQGQLLRLNKIDDVPEEADNHLAEELAKEISKGLYIGA